MKRLGALISPMIKQFGMEEAVRLEGIKKNWTIIFREPLSAHMSPAGLKNGELLLTVDSPIWLQQLTFLRAEIIGNLRPYGVKDIRFRLGRVVRAAEKERGSKRGLPEKFSLGGDAAAQIDDTVSKLENTALKENIRRAMERSLSTRNPKS